MKKLTKTEQIIAEKTVCVLLVRGENNEGKKIYAYVAIRADRLQEFMDAQKKGAFYPEEYGIIVEAGEGEPSQEVKEKMTKEYGFNHDEMVDIPDTDKAGVLTAEIIASAKAVE